jgi:phage terminase Nu1 subunit (DNA packaging protein)
VSECYVDRLKLAELLGVSVSTIKRWDREGLPSETWGIRVRRYSPSQCRAWARSRTTMSSTPKGDVTAPGQRQQED